MATLQRAFASALAGIADTVRRERNIKIELGFAVFAIVAGALLALEPLEWALIALTIAAVLAAELVNTAIEAAVDLASPKIHPLAKRAKDAAAGAVLLLAAASVVVGLIVFINAAARLVQP